MPSSMMRLESVMLFPFQLSGVVRRARRMPFDTM